jgi:hypothetical protein
MQPLALSTTDSFTYWLDVQPVALVPGQHVLTIKSQWLGAKDPTERRRSFQTVIPLSDVQGLHQWLGRYLASLPVSNS